MRKKIEDAIQNKQVQERFSDKWKLYNECTLLEYDAATENMQEHRPDRVMTNGKEWVVVDFKFGKEREEYKKQVQRYMQILQQMGNKNVSGYLWYVVNNSIVKVNI